MCLNNCWGKSPHFGEFPNRRLQGFYIILYLHDMKSIICVFLLLSLKVSTQNLTKFVNPFIGTGGHGHTYPGATLPFGFVQLSPDTRPDGYNDWDGCGGYHYSDSIIYGFSHTHLSGTGIADYCDILLMPTVGEPQLNNIINNNPKKGYASAFSHKTEKASPGYYSVLLEDDNIPVELTATARVGMHKYIYPDTGKINIVLDLRHRDKLLEGSYIEIISPTKIQGLRRSSSWAKDQWLYFAIEFSEPFNYAEIIDSTNSVMVRSQQFGSKILSGTHLNSFFQFLGDGGKTIMVKCALSPVSCVGAWKNMQAEIPHWDFEKVKKDADLIWNKELSKIEVKSITDEKKSLTDPENKLVIFYSALYHCMLAPNIYEDVDGKYRGRDNKIHSADEFDYYTVFSLWDTYRALHPLLTIIDQKRTNDFINTFLRQYEQGGRLPVWELSSNETDCMIGYHSVSVIADAAAKGIRGYDMNLAYEAMKHSANLDHFGLKYYKEKGYIESNEEPESVSKTMEYSYDDWCIANYQTLIQEIEFEKDSTKKSGGSVFQVNDEYKFNSRAKNFANLIDSNLFARPRFNGGWYKPFDPKEVNFNYTEANAWQYSFSYPQYMNELILMESFSNKVGSKYENLLDSLFTTSAKTTGRNQSDITGLIGQYAHGNEPSHHIAYLYNTLTPWKTQYYVNKIKNDFYKNAPDGLIGNEDCGQMSAWYVFSAMGFYPATPGGYGGTYELGTPSFDTIKIHLENGKIFNVFTAKESEKSIFIEKARILNSGKPFDLYFPQINHSDILEADTLTLLLTDKSNQIRLSAYLHPKFGVRKTAPIFIYESSTFKDSITISFELFKNNGNYWETDNQIYYTIDGSNPDYGSIKYDGPFTIFNSTIIKAFRGGEQVSTAVFTKLSHNYKINYLTKYNSQYTAGGETALIDGMHGGADFRTGMWQGWQKENMEVVLDLGEIKEITKAGAGFLQDVRSWIWMPAKLEIYTSTDGKKYTLSKTIVNNTPSDNYDSKEIKNVEAELNAIKTRYVKFVAYNFGTVPNWHPGKGGDTWVFCDEVWVK